MEFIEFTTEPGVSAWKGGKFIAFVDVFVVKIFLVHTSFVRNKITFAHFYGEIS